MYTMKDWERDHSFKAYPLQEIEPEIYYEFLNCMPPLSLPRSLNKTSVEAGFMCSEPSSCNKNGSTYAAFGQIRGKYYYLGDLNAD